MAELGEFVIHHAELQALDVQVLGISADSIEKARETQSKLHTLFPILSDSEDKVMDQYGTRSPVYKGPGGTAINPPTLVLTDRTGTIRWLHQAADYRVRSPFSQDLEEIRKLK